MPKKKKSSWNTYRFKLLLAALGFFAIALILSSLLLFFERNTISGNNITIDIEAPFAIGGGERLELDVNVINRNNVPIESATLIAEYPPGTRTAEGDDRELFRERIPLGRIGSGEGRTVPLAVRLFGEENDERVITISVEYRVEGSNATFFREADPLRLQISSSPVVLSLDSVSEVSSGQELVFTLTLASNSPTALQGMLVEATYPQGFDFSGATPSPARGQNTWTISSLEPESEQTIEVRGVLTGGSEEARTVRFSVGVPGERDPFSLASVFATVAEEIRLTDPFIGLDVTVDGSRERTVSAAPDAVINVSITFENTLSDAIYDGTIRAVLSGNGLNTQNIRVSNGFFDSSTRTIRWDAQDVQGLRELVPGARQNVRFTIHGADIDATRTPEVSFDVSASGRRVSETRVPQDLTNLVSRTVRFASVASLSSQALYSIGPFSNSGPQPPRAEESTQYTITLRANNGSNALADARVSATLPSYVTWTDTVTSGDAVSYSASTREVVWNIGDIAAGASAEASFQVSFLPSVSQVGTLPTLIGEQHFRATDRFTGTVVRATARALTTRLSDDPDSGAQNGVVQAR